MRLRVLIKRTPRLEAFVRGGKKIASANLLESSVFVWKIYVRNKKVVLPRVTRSHTCSRRENAKNSKIDLNFYSKTNRNRPRRQKKSNLSIDGAKVKLSKISGGKKMKRRKKIKK